MMRGLKAAVDVVLESLLVEQLPDDEGTEGTG